MNKVLCFLGLHQWTLCEAVDEVSLDKETRTFLAVSHSTYGCIICAKQRLVKVILREF